MLNDEVAFFMIVMLTVAVSFVLSLPGRKPRTPERVLPKEGVGPGLFREEVIKNFSDRK